MRHARFYFSPDGSTSADSTEAVLNNVFGGLDTVRPDLAAAEVKEREEQKNGKRPTIAARAGEPELDKPAEAEQTTESKTNGKPEAARTAPPAEGTDAAGSDSESPADDDAALEALVAKYQGKPRSMASAIREIRSLQTRTAEQKKEVEDRLEAAASIIDSDYDWIEGKPVLKADVAARHLRGLRGNGAPPNRPPSEDEIRAQVQADFAKYGSKLVEEDQLPAYLTQMRPLIDQTVAERVQSAKVTHEAQLVSMRVAVGDVVGRHLTAHPEDKDLLPEIDKFYAGIPEEARIIALLEDWVPFGQVAELVRIKKSLPKIAKDAYELGKKHRGAAATVTEPGSPGRSRPTPTRERGSSSDAVRQFKDGVLGGAAANLPSIDELFAK